LPKSGSTGAARRAEGGREQPGRPRHRPGWCRGWMRLAGRRHAVGRPACGRAASPWRGRYAGVTSPVALAVCRGTELWLCGGGPARGSSRSTGICAPRPMPRQASPCPVEARWPGPRPRRPGPVHRFRPRRPPPSAQDQSTTGLGEGPAARQMIGPLSPASPSGPRPRVGGPTRWTRAGDPAAGRTDGGHGGPPAGPGPAPHHPIPGPRRLPPGASRHQLPDQRCQGHQILEPPQGAAGGERHERVGRLDVRPARRHGPQGAGAVPEVDALLPPAVAVAQQLKALAAQRVEGVRDAEPSRTVRTRGS
jgi:hypothetical protein